MTTQLYQPVYSNSHALVIGINAYRHVSPLAYAANDAAGVSSALKALGFPDSNITLLTDSAATRSAIMAAYMRFTDINVAGPDDRLFVFFAGHGHTASGKRGETGFLVPVDGKLEDLSTLVKWSELTESADLIAAKHVFFLMDACYGGLAFTRNAIPPGSMRFLEDMLQRYSRQVLTAGKADETVSDGNGTRPRHSIFTSHVLDALSGAASATPGVVTANGVMAYVYQKVGSDPRSQQTPHYGFLEGDGDFVFSPQLGIASPHPTGPQTLVQSTALPATQLQPPQRTTADEVKDLISVGGPAIQLNDMVMNQVKSLAQNVGPTTLPTSGTFEPGEFARRVKIMDEETADLLRTVTLISRWGSLEQVRVIEKILSRLAQADKGQGGYTNLINLGWYPALLVIYAGGITALSEDRFDVLKTCLLTSVSTDKRQEKRPVILPAIWSVTDIHDAFKTLPGLEKRYTPRSDHMFQVLQPILEDHLFLGKGYEPLFDKFEALLALIFADTKGDTGTGLWGPPGRFAWRNGPLGNHHPLQEVIAEASVSKDSWPLITHGFFGGKFAQFESVATRYEQKIASLGWW